MSKKTWMVAFDEKGDHVSNDRYCSWGIRKNLEYKEPGNFYDRLIYTGYDIINSGVAFKWTSIESGITYISSIEMVDRLLKEIQGNGRLYGEFEFYKKGTSTFIRLVR